MRTTVTLDSDVQSRLAQLMHERGWTFKKALNTTLRTGLGTGAPTDITFPTFDMGASPVNLTHANQLAADLEDHETARELALGR